MRWTGRAPAPNRSRMSWGLEVRGAHRHVPKDSRSGTNHWDRYRQEPLHLIGLDDKGAIVLREKVPRGRITARSPMCRDPDRNRSWHGDALCGSRANALGHDVKQVPPAYAKPFRQGHKNDFRDAHAIAEAVQRPSTRCVPVKTDDQLDLQALHRVRYGLVGQRTAVINQIRGFLLEHGIRYVRGFASFANNSRTSCLNAATCCHLA